MEIYQVRYVLAAAQTLNFTRAAAHCNVSQPALTKAIKALETELGAQLFHREGKRVLLSEFGRSLLPHFGHIIAETDTTRTMADDYRLKNSIPIRLGILSTIGQTRIARFLAEFQGGHAGIELEASSASTAELKQRLEDGDLDLAILNPQEGLGPDYRVHQLYRERYVVLLPPGHVMGDRDGIRLAELSGEPYVDRLSCEMREMVIQVCRDRQVTLYARFRSEREDWVQSMVAAGIGFAFVPEYSVGEAGGRQRPLVDPEVARVVALATMPGRRHSPAAASFVNAARIHDWERAT